MAAPAQPGSAHSTLVTERDRVRYHGAFTLSGSVTGDQGCQAPYEVEIWRRILGSPEPKLMEPFQTDSDGNWSGKLRSGRSAAYKARVASTAACSGEPSERVDVLVHVDLEGIAVCSHGDTISKSGEQGICCMSSSIRGELNPDHRGSVVKWKAKLTGRWRTQDEDQVTRQGAFYLRDHGRNSCGGHRLIWPRQSIENLRTRRRGV